MDIIIVKYYYFIITYLRKHIHVHTHLISFTLYIVKY